MTLADCLSLFLLLSALAALPSMSVMLVVSRTLSSGVSQGAMVTLGIVLADLLYMLVAIFGLTYVTMWLDKHAWLLKILAVVILILFSYQLWQARDRYTVISTSDKSHTRSSFLAGFTLTLIDYKAVFFYIGIVPIYLDNTTITLSSLLLLLSTTVIAVASVKLAYVFLAKQVQHVVFLQTSYRLISVILFFTALWLSLTMLFKQLL